MKRTTQTLFVLMCLLGAAGAGMSIISVFTMDVAQASPRDP